MAYLGNDLQVAFPTYRNIDDISSSFNGVLTSFQLTVSGVAPIPAPINSQQCLISVNGVVQRPDDSGTEGFRLSGGNIIFASAPAGGVDFFGVILAGADYVNAGANFPSGTAAVPSITFDSDLDTGVYNPAANQLGITTGGTARLIIDASGQIRANSLGSASAPVITFNSDPNTGIYSPGADQLAISTNGTGRLFVDSGAGNIDFKSPTNQNSTLRIYPNGAAVYAGAQFFNPAGTQAAQLLVASGSEVYLDSGGNGSINYRASGIGTHVWSTNGTEKARITSDGKLGLGTSSPSYIFHVSKSSTSATDVAFTNNGGTAIIGVEDSSGAGILSGAGAYDFSIRGLGSRGISFGIGYSAPSMRIDSSGRVGVGTSTPSDSQAFGNAIDMRGSTGAAYYAGNAGSGTRAYFGAYTGVGGYLATETNHPLLFYTNNSEKLRITSDGKLGLGTSAPSEALHVVSTAGEIVYAESNRNTNGQYVGGLITAARNSSGNSVPYAGIYGSITSNTATTESGALTFWTRNSGGSAERARIDSSGRLLVGTSSNNSSFNAAVQIAGSSSASTQLMARFDNNAGAPNLYFAKSRGASVGTNTVVQSGDNIGVLGFYGADGTGYINTAEIRVDIDGTPGTNDMPGRLVFSTTADSASSPTERMRIDSSGNVGLGTSTPSSDGPLTLANASETPTIFFSRPGSGSFSAAIQASSFGTLTFYNGAASSTVSGLTPRLTIDGQTGAVGIGTTSPATKAHIDGGSTGTSLTVANGGYATMRIGSPANGTALIAVDTGEKLAFGTQSSPGTSYTEYARIDSSGRLLVGTSSNRGNWFNSSSWGGALVQVESTTDTNSAFSVVNSSNNSNSPLILLGKNRSGGVGGNTVVQSGDACGQLSFFGNDGAEMVEAARIAVAVDGTPGADDMPGRLVFSTTADGASSPTERVRVTSAGFTKHTGNGVAYYSATSNNHEFNSDHGSYVLILKSEHASQPAGIFIKYTATPNNTASPFIEFEDNAALRFKVVSNGGIYNYSGNNSNLSDEREKKNVESLDSTWGCLKNWELKKFHYNEDADTDDKRYGVIAQQVAPHCPEVISEWVKQQAAEAVLDDDGNVVTPAVEEVVRMGVKEQQMMWMAIKALQEAQLRIETLEAEVAALKGA